MQYIEVRFQERGGISPNWNAWTPKLHFARRCLRRERCNYMWEVWVVMWGHTLGPAVQSVS